MAPRKPRAEPETESIGRKMSETQLKHSQRLDIANHKDNTIASRLLHKLRQMRCRWLHLDWVQDKEGVTYVTRYTKL